MKGVLYELVFAVFLADYKAVRRHELQDAAAGEAVAA